MQNDYLARVYAGFLGMNVGIRLGAPVEPTIWTYERIKETYGDIRGYVKDYKNFAADEMCIRDRSTTDTGGASYQIACSALRK